MPCELRLGTVPAHRIVDEGPVTLGLVAELQNLSHEVLFVRASEENGDSATNGQAGKDSENVVGRVAHVLVTPQLPRNPVHDDEGLLVRSGKLVSLIEEFSGLK